MFLLRLRPVYLFLVLMIPMLAGFILQQAPAYAGTHALRLQVLGTNLSTIFAVIFCGWIGTLVWALAPGVTTRSLLIAGLSLSMAFRAWQDSWSIDALYATGKMPGMKDVELFSPLFVMHALVSLFMLYVFVLLAVWLVRGEKAADSRSQPLWLTILELLAFPVGLFWIQKRTQAVIAA